MALTKNNQHHTPMTSETHNTIVLTAESGYVLTQSADVDIKERIVASRVALSKYSTVDDWKEITTDEGDRIIAEQNALREAEIAEREEN